MPFEIIRNDITKMKVDAIVNSANPHVVIGNGVDGAIHAVAGPKLFEARKIIGDIPVGDAVATPAFELNAKYVIHTVGPIWRGGTDCEIENVKKCYKNTLKVVLEKQCKSVAFPLISTGTYGFPKPEALHIAISVIGEFLILYDIKVFLVVYDFTSYALSEKLSTTVKAYINDNYVRKHPEYYQTESFSQLLLHLIDKKYKSDVAIYKKANVDRKLFSKIRRNKDYNPSKVTAIAFAIALELNLDETKDLIGRAGIALTHSNLFDIIIEFFIVEENYNVFEINEVLFAFDQVLLGV